MNKERWGKKRRIAKKGDKKKMGVEKIRY